ncbi:hypothetical protein ACFVJ5_27555 [Nocardia sp. NPDC127606]|uniref:hypothetical protein n=1 Tax=Nocardia sp. NPDC127606 TaxID=3345406 RepID=UPI00362FBC5C
MKGVESSSEPSTALRNVLHAFAVHHARGHTGARTVSYEPSSLTPEHNAEVLDIHHRIDREIRELVERGVTAGAFDTPSPRMATVALLSLGIDIARWYRDEGERSPEDIAAAYADMALHIVGAR